MEKRWRFPLKMNWTEIINIDNVLVMTIININYIIFDDIIGMVGSYVAG